MPKKSLDPSQPLVKKYRIKSVFGMGNGFVRLAIYSRHSGPKAEEIPCHFILIDPALTVESGLSFGSTGEIAGFRNQVFEVQSYGDFTLQSVRKPTDEDLAEIDGPPKGEVFR